MDTLERSRRIGRLGLGGLLVAGALTTLSACGGSASSDLKITETEPGANQYALSGVKPIKGGTVKITLTNKGKVPHGLSLIRVEGTHSQTEVLDALKKVTSGMDQPLADFLVPAGGVEGVKPGQTGIASAVVPPGNYYAVDTDSGEGDNAPAYFTQGAVKPLEVKGGKSTGSLPKADQTIAIKDVPGDQYEFVNPATLKSGKTTIELDNQSKTNYHHVLFFPLGPGKTVADAKKFLTASAKGPPMGPPPIDFMAGVGTDVIEHSRKLVAEVNLPKPGNYVMLCFVSDRDGKGGPHLGKGLLKEVKVSK